MPRETRRTGLTGYLHLIVRGNNKQILFEETDDYRFFISRLGRYSRETEVPLSAYCLMENHVHLLVHDRQCASPEMMHRLTVSYSHYFNQKYNRYGHLFQGRYLSEPIDDEVYLLTVFRYILNNPTKAGICPANLYRWSSYKAYFRENTPLDLSFIRNRFPAEDAYREYISAATNDKCLEYNCNPPKTGDERAQKIIREDLNVKSGSELQSWKRQERDAALQRLRQNGLSLRQIERLTGISRSVIQRV